ncbi:MAG TPA: malto-oligosyltrehalose synthase [Lacunisphaera sp.]|jgi:(1->4)-alpha-D-glucan 1-alpha-D-glucosylmutase
MPLTESAHIPRCTYRVQLRENFNFGDLANLVPYFRALGISDFYLSPIFAATPGSTHGYDVTDYGTVNPELGGGDGFDLLATRLRSEGFNLLLDFVPNHMGIAGVLNSWWRDVLENGKYSAYEPFFDIQWKAEGSRGHPWVLVPLLEDHYGKVLEEGKISLTYSDSFALQYADILLPVSPGSYSWILKFLVSSASTEEADSILLPVIAEFDALPRPIGVPDAELARKRGDAVNQLKQQTATVFARHPPLRKKLDGLLKKINGTPGDPKSFDQLDRLIERQHYRLARWKTGTHEINYRRFFAIDSLVGLHMEKPEVFRAAHELLGRFVREGKVTGLRIDHIDGLRQPEDYLRRLQSLERPDASKPLYVLVEKILARDETLPDDWPVHGTTGYEFIPQLAAVLSDSSPEDEFDKIYAEVTGETGSLEDQIYAKKRQIIAEMFVNAVSNLGAELVEILAVDRRWRDLTRHELTTAVSELMANLPVYRTYRRRQQTVSAADRSVLEKACIRALVRNPRAEPEPFEFVRDLLIGHYPPADADADFRSCLLSWVLTFQQYTGAVMAKAVEDTAFYTFNRLIAFNEVGGSAEFAGNSVADFHRVSLDRLARNPHSMLATSTHDTKFSEDVRARLYALTELVNDWGGWVREWIKLAARHTTALEGGIAPDSLDQYRFFQVLLGAWPLGETEPNEDFRGRLRGYFRKSVNEAKRHTSILQANEPYLAACEKFVDGLVNTESGRDFLSAFVPCAQHVAGLGMVNSLTQVVLKCTSPGMPDFYQGNEIWDFSLVDPDNRREIDFARRSRLLEALPNRTPSDLLVNWRDGAIKLFATQKLLQARARLPALFASGNYAAVTITGNFRDHVIAFTRNDAVHSLLVVAPRLNAKLGSPPVGPVWDDTRVILPDETSGWRDVFTNRVFAPGHSLLMRALFAELPFAVLEKIAPTSSTHEN